MNGEEPRPQNSGSGVLMQLMIVNAVIIAGLLIVLALTFPI
jgi:hypothetical protein